MLPGEHRGILRQLDEDWRRVVSLAVTGAVLDEAVRVADKYGLRAYDAIHLASAITLRTSLEETILLPHGMTNWTPQPSARDSLFYGMRPDDSVAGRSGRQRAAGLAPLRIPSTSDAARRNIAP